METTLDINTASISGLPLNVLLETAASVGVSIAEKDEKAHLILMDALDGTVQSILALPTYEQPPDLAKYSRTDIHRPKAEDNPNNEWVHRFSLKATDAAPNGLLAGKVLAVKDNVGVAGVPSTLGADVIEPYIPTIDATIVTRILDAGGQIIGTATCEYMSMTPMSYSAANGVVGNPYHEAYTAGGSSSGSTVLVSKGAVDMSIGGDQGGSIRLPAAFCGVVGLKPTYGLVPYTGIASLEPTIDHTGPLTRTVLDNARLLTALAGYDGIDDRQLGAPKPADITDYLGVLEAFAAQAPTASPLKGMKIGILKEAFEVPMLAEAMKDKVLASAAMFRKLGATVEEVSVPLHPLGAAIWMCALRSNASLTGLQGQAMGRRAYTSPGLSKALGKAYNEHPQETFDKVSRKNPAAATTIIHGKYLATKYPGLTAKAFTHVRQLRDAYEAALKDGGFDVMIAPVTPTVAVRHPHQDDSILTKIMINVGVTTNTAPFNVSGHPAMSLPVGWLEVGDEEGQKEGIKMPVGMQIIGKLWDEVSIYKAAYAWEKAFDWKKL